MSDLYNYEFYLRHRAISEFSASKILPLLAEIVRPDTCIDIGCGIGTWLSAAKELWGCAVVGVDGGYVDKNQLCIDPANFRAQDLSDPLPPLGKFDIAICMEVIEHLPPSRGASLIDELCSLSDVVLFSGAVPNQGGTGHINEQWPSTWVTEFEKSGYRCFDIIRPFVWSDESIAFYYRQNAFVAVNQSNSQLIGRALDVMLRTPVIWDVVHPTRMSSVLKLINVPMSFRRATRMFVRSFIEVITRPLRRRDPR